jgi:hypothetical protein
MLTEGNTAGGASLRLSLARRTGDLEAEYAAVGARVLPGLSPDVRDAIVRYRVAQADLSAREAWRTWLQGQVSAYQAEIVMAPNREMDITRLQAEVERARTLYATFQQQSAAAQIAEAFQQAKMSGRFIIMEPANRPNSPGKPNRPLVVMLAFVIGAVVGVGTALVVEHHDQSVKNVDEIEQMLGLPVLGQVPRVEELQRPGRAARAAPGGGPGSLPAPRDQGLIQRFRVESPLGLEFKRLYLNLARSRGRELPRVIMVTSSLGVPRHHARARASPAHAARRLRPAQPGAAPRAGRSRQQLGARPDAGCAQLRRAFRAPHRAARPGLPVGRAQ